MVLTSWPSKAVRLRAGALPERIEERPDDAAVFHKVCCDTYSTVTFVCESGKDKTSPMMSVASVGIVKNVFFGMPDALSMA